MPQHPTKTSIKTREEPDLRLQQVFAESFCAARMEAGLSQKDVAEISGLAQQTVSQIECARHNLTLRTMTKLGKVVGQEVSELLRFEPRRAARSGNR
jgi:transcriptional regulator with XRE-family HTH domain